ncbi:hypothetical protein K1F50_11020 [Muricauda oceani]|uniref:Uncharacterized protein n=1 Tax=Flagellimonas oceani TaxID=2698672 RepID=A0A6G7J3F0_9FLAO|nr:hypothetical protein [Allomuricauda oceani]MBW8243333.1 hypothetical protein [Allomuricauda oceani]QII45306.1 hypothetical protein GVT53_11650 [Allomuricauda oceani]
MSISKRYLLILSSIIILLLVPFVAMQFSSEVNWSLFDFLVAGGLLTVLGFSIDFAIRKATSTQMRFALIAGIVIVFLLVWAELAVGVFGTPFAGS